MRIEQVLTVNVPIQSLWDFFFDIERMSACIPGVERMQQLDKDNYAGTLSVRVGPIAANFGGKVSLQTVEPPNRLVAKLEGKDARTASLATGTFTVALTAVTASQTEIAYEIDFALRGALGRFGQGVMREVAKRLATEFSSCVEAQF